MRTGRTSNSNILIVHTGTFSPFAALDARILGQRHHVETFGLASLGSLPFLWRKIRTADIVIFWFVGRAAICGMIPPPRHPKVISIIGGYEAAWVPEIQYGYAGSPLRRRLVRFVLRRSDRIVAVSRFSRAEIYKNLGWISENVELVYNATDTDYYVPGPAEREESQILTVSRVSASTMLRKGLDVLYATARQVPECRFTIVGPVHGRESDRLAEDAPPNVEFVGEQSGSALLQYYQQASVYFQPSRYESFGVALIEAMSCGCVPVVSPHGALPEVVGDAGYVLERLDPEHAAAVLRQALNAPPAAREQARARVVQNFDMRQRAEKLHKLIDELLAEKNATAS